MQIPPLKQKLLLLRFQAESVQGGVLGDAINSFFSALAMNMPNTTFSQNNGVIALTGVSSRLAGLACAFFLILFGVLGKVRPFFLHF
jgi:xanthine/uracil permease